MNWIIPRLKKAILSVGLLFLTLSESYSADKQQSNEPLPPAQEIIAKYVKAVGGAEAFAKYKSQSAKGKFEMPAQGMVGEVEMLAARPDKFLMRMNLPGLGQTVSGYNGKIGFSSNPATGPMLVEGKALDQLKDQADYDSALHEPSKFKSMQTLERTQFEGQDVYKVKLVRVTGDVTTEYFDTKTGLIVGTEGVQESPLGPIQVVGTLGDYKKFGGILMATKLVQKMAGIQQVVTLSSVEFDKVPESVFDLPAEVKALSK
jgi:zinc protease